MCCKRLATRTNITSLNFCHVLKVTIVNCHLSVLCRLAITKKFINFNHKNRNYWQKIQICPRFSRWLAGGANFFDGGLVVAMEFFLYMFREGKVGFEHTI